MVNCGRDQISKGDATTVATIEAAVPALVTARNLVNPFQAMLLARNSADLDDWIRDATDSSLSIPPK